MLGTVSLELGETIHRGELENVEVMYLEKGDAPHSIRLVSGMGVRLSAYATALGRDCSPSSTRIRSPHGTPRGVVR